MNPLSTTKELLSDLETLTAERYLVFDTLRDRLAPITNIALNNRTTVDDIDGSGPTGVWVQYSYPDGETGSITIPYEIVDAEDPVQAWKDHEAQLFADRETYRQACIEDVERKQYKDLAKRFGPIDLTSTVDQA